MEQNDSLVPPSRVIESKFIYKYSNRYYGIRSDMHEKIYDAFCVKKMYDDFNPERILSHSHMIYDYVDRYLYDCKDIKDVILNYRNILINIMSCMFTLNLRMRVIHGFFDSVVDYMIENDSYQQFNNRDDLIILFTYISPEKLYNYIDYMYHCEGNEEKKEYIHQHISEKIYKTILYNSAIITMVQYGYADVERVGEIVYKYYILITKLVNDGILINKYEKMEHSKYEFVICNRSKDPLYTVLLTNIMNEMSIHRNKKE